MNNKRDTQMYEELMQEELIVTKISKKPRTITKQLY